MAKPSVLFINRTYPPVRSTSGRLLRDLAQAFEEAGWQVTVLTTDKKAVHDRDGSISLIKIAAPANHGNMFVSLWIWLKLFLAGWSLPKSDLIITMSDPPMIIIAGKWLSKIKKARHMHWCQELYPDLFPALEIYVPSFLMQILKSATRRAMNNCEKIIVPGRCMARYLLRSGVDRQKITVIPNWADLQLTNAVEKNEELVSLTPENRNDGTRPAFPYDDAPKFRIMHTGHIKRFHELSTILKAAELLDGPHPEIEFVFVGTGAPFDRLADERARRGLRNIRLMPFQPAEQVELVMKMGDVHLISLKKEATALTIPRRLHTALSVERPCLFIGEETSDAAGIIKEYEAGRTIIPGNPEALARQILHYRFNGDDWFAAQKGAQRAAQALSPQKSLKNWLSLAAASNPLYKKAA